MGSVEAGSWLVVVGVVVFRLLLFGVDGGGCGVVAGLSSGAGDRLLSC